jgi:hypothetical protein
MPIGRMAFSTGLLKTWRLAMTVDAGNYVELLQAVAKAKDVCSYGGTSSALWLTRPWLT